MKANIFCFNIVIFLFCFLFSAANLFAEADSWGEIKKFRHWNFDLDHNGADYFGCAVAVDENTTIVGASWYNSYYYGFAFIYERNVDGANAWGEVKILSASDAKKNRADWFGASVAIDENVAVVGAPEIDAAYVFERNADGANYWGQVKKLTVANADNFANSVAVAGNTAIVTAPPEAYVFHKNTGGINAWGEIKKLSASDGNSAFSGLVASEGEFAVFSAGNAAYIFETNNWTEVKKLTVTNIYNFGWPVAMDKNIAIIGAAGKYHGWPDAAFIFERNSGGANNWGEVKKLTSPVGMGFSYSVAIKDDIAAVRGQMENPPFYYNSAVYLFNRHTNNWGMVKKLTATGDKHGYLGNNAGFGCSIAFADDAVFVGAKDQDVNYSSLLGVTYIFGKYGPAPSETFAAANPLPDDTGIAEGSNTNATTEPGEPAHAGNGGPYHSVWWDWSETTSAFASESAAAGDTLLVDTHGSDFDTVLAVYTGLDVSNLTQIAANDDSGPGIETSEVSFTFNSGETYHIVVDGKTTSDTGNIVLNYAVIPEPMGIWIIGILGLWIIVKRVPGACLGRMLN